MTRGNGCADAQSCGTDVHTHTHTHTHWGAVEAEAEEDVVDERPRPKNACQIDK